MVLEKYEAIYMTKASSLMFFLRFFRYVFFGISFQSHICHVFISALLRQAVYGFCFLFNIFFYLNESNRLSLKSCNKEWMYLYIFHVFQKLMSDVVYLLSSKGYLCSDYGSQELCVTNQSNYSIKYRQNNGKQVKEVDCCFPIFTK